ncbi:hypothetical protein HCN44_002420 [Aphidius gifuensis]|uniref:Uncharacterized protein n=1 Tax=Aphidius gifuensis TaxID=684658 RepID=A0A834Y425_APHGI|nr:hypothetical protein HCN44_002420 [Aphidius gifuensis]
MRSILIFLLNIFIILNLTYEIISQELNNKTKYNSSNEYYQLIGNTPNDTNITINWNDNGNNTRDKRALGIFLQGLAQALGYNTAPIQLASLPNPNTLGTSQTGPVSIDIRSINPMTSSSSSLPVLPGGKTISSSSPRQRETLRFTGVVNFGNNSDVIGHLRQYEKLFHGSSMPNSTAIPVTTSTTPVPTTTTTQSSTLSPPKAPLLEPYLVPIPIPLAEVDKDSRENYENDESNENKDNIKMINQDDEIDSSEENEKENIQEEEEESTEELDNSEELNNDKTSNENNNDDDKLKSDYSNKQGIKFKAGFGISLPIVDQPVADKLMNSYGQSLEHDGRIDKSIADYFGRYKNPKSGLYDKQRILSAEAKKRPWLIETKVPYSKNKQDNINLAENKNDKSKLSRSKGSRKKNYNEENDREVQASSTNKKYRHPEKKINESVEKIEEFSNDQKINNKKQESRENDRDVSSSRKKNRHLEKKRNESIEEAAKFSSSQKRNNKKEVSQENDRDVSSRRKKNRNSEKNRNGSDETTDESSDNSESKEKLESNDKSNKKEPFIIKTFDFIKNSAFYKPIKFVYSPGSLEKNAQQIVKNLEENKNYESEEYDEKTNEKQMNNSEELKEDEEEDEESAEESSVVDIKTDKLPKDDKLIKLNNKKKQNNDSVDEKAATRITKSNNSQDKENHKNNTNVNDQFENNNHNDELENSKNNNENSAEDTLVNYEEQTSKKNSQNTDRQRENYRTATVTPADQKIIEKPNYRSPEKSVEVSDEIYDEQESIQPSTTHQTPVKNIQDDEVASELESILKNPIKKSNLSRQKPSTQINEDDNIKLLQQIIKNKNQENTSSNNNDYSSYQLPQIVNIPRYYQQGVTAYPRPIYYQKNIENQRHVYQSSPQPINHENNKPNYYDDIDDPHSTIGYFDIYKIKYNPDYKDSNYSINNKFKNQQIQDRKFTVDKKNQTII